MCGGSAPDIKPTPAPPTIAQAATDEDVVARDNTRKRLAAAQDTRTTMLSSQTWDGKKTFLGQ